MGLVPIEPGLACDLVRRWHYSGSAVPGVVRYGWADGGEIIGVSIFDPGHHATRQGVFGPEHFRHVLHHHRLALRPDAPAFTAGRFIAASLRQLRMDRPETWAVVTYADTCEGHHGTVYQATNAIYTGLYAKGNLKFRTPEGVLIGTQSLSWVGTWPERRRWAAEHGWTEVRCGGKHRYVYLLGTPTERRRRPPMLWEALPYPKG